MPQLGEATVGATIKMEITGDLLPLDGGATVKLAYKKSDGTTGEWTATITDVGTVGGKAVVTYQTTSAADLAGGVMEIQPIVSKGSVVDARGTVASFSVIGKLS